MGNHLRRLSPKDVRTLNSEPTINLHTTHTMNLGTCGWRSATYEARPKPIKLLTVIHLTPRECATTSSVTGH